MLLIFFDSSQLPLDKFGMRTIEIELPSSCETPFSTETSYVVLMNRRMDLVLVLHNEPHVGKRL